MARHCKATDGDQNSGRKTVEQINKERDELIKRFDKWTPKTIQDETADDKAYELKRSLRDEERKASQDAGMSRIQKHAAVVAARIAASKRAIKASL